tara:strand:- start:216 stop:494 length:279 start_codon:yes stop_codon:yes gene_type:complete
MAIILIETSSASAANDIVSAVAGQSLWGVDMGTTSKASAHADRALVECTTTRAGDLQFACPEDAIISIYDENPLSFSAATQDGQVWYLRALL